MSYDIIVVGAGPGGATTAATAAQAGLRVLLIDQAAFPREKVCGDAISGKSLDVLRGLGLVDQVAQASSLGSWGVVFGGPAGDTVDVPFTSSVEAGDQPPGFVCARDVFDALIVRRSVDAGADLRERTTVRSIVRENGSVAGVRLSSNGSSTTEYAPIVVGADGAYSIVARDLGMDQLRDRHYYAGVRAYYEGVEGLHDRNFIELHFVDAAVPGYFWIFPMAGGRANVGIGTLSARIKREGLRLKSVLEAVLADGRFGPRFRRARRIGRVRGWGMPLGSAPRRMAGGGWMLVGDAASLIDPFTGEGIGNAMVSGRLAAETALEALDGGDPALLHGYERRVNAALGPELRLSYTLRRLERWKWLLSTVIRKAGRDPELAAMIGCMFEDLDVRRKLASPLFYLRVLRA